jgi:5'-nucleotidase
VAISGPTQNNSGQGGAMAFLTPIGNLSKDTRWGTVQAGAPGVGQDPSDANIYYVDGTPVAAALHGLDVVAPQLWGKQPDLVISGPNDGNNLGILNNSSGTFNNALYGVNRGIPSIAVSDADSSAKSYTSLATGAIEYEKADIVVKLVEQLSQNTVSGGKLLPPGLGLRPTAVKAWYGSRRAA